MYTTVNALSQEQIYHYFEFGYVLVSGLIARDVANRADDYVFKYHDADRNDPSTWKRIRRDFTTECPEIVATYTPAYRHACAQLISHDPHLFPAGGLPTNGYVLTIPVHGDGEWVKDYGHMDGSGSASYIVHSFPQQWRMFSMIYFHDCEPGGGNTRVWPKSHRKWESLLRSMPEKYRFSHQLIADRALLELGEPIELVPQAGDVAFLDQRCWHAGSDNLGKRPRMAMNFKW